MAAGPVDFDTLPALPLHTLNPVHSTGSYVSSTSSTGRNSNDMVRSASYTSLPGLAQPPAPGIKRTFSENVLGSLAQTPSKISSSVQSANVELFRRASTKTKRRMSTARFASSNEADVYRKEKSQQSNMDTDGDKNSARSMTGSFKSFARRSSWMPGSTSRSTSPADRNDGQRGSSRPGKKRSQSPPKKKPGFSNGSITVPQPVLTRTSPRLQPQEEDYLPRHDSAILPPSVHGSETSFDPDSEASSKRLSRQSSFSSLKSRASMGAVYMSVRPKMPPLPTNVSPERSAKFNAESTKKKDPLWIQFRSADGEYASFHSKPGLQKAKVIRTFLLPFLAKHADHPSNNCLRAEDLDRRTVILNKWWTCLLDLLNGAHQQSVSATDRPAFLEATTEIMLRPEWRLPSNPATSSANSQDTVSLTRSDSSGTSDGDDPDFLITSIHQNVRNMFVQNLLAQLAFVVDKLSMRTAPASLVAFGGKACAYAFMYCPGVADMLCRLWHVPMGSIRRVFAEYPITDTQEIQKLSKELLQHFPVPVRSLCFTTHSGLARHIQHKTQYPPGSGSIRWYGPWVNRWSGRDSDLFFIFIKHYHLLVSQMLPRQLLPYERVAIPGLVPIHSQILIVLEATLYRQAGHFAAEHYAVPNNSDNPDAMAPLPMIINNATRSIGENRLVMLLREVASDGRTDDVPVAELLVGSFQYILKAATRKISMYNNDACFVLCDFLEELMPIVSRYQQSHSESEDWTFWLQVFKRMLASHTTMTQIRVLAFLYSTWTILISNDDRKRDMVLNWLLTPEFFSSYFNHWSPMVRHYFYRLICWRIGRCDGQASDVDLEIFQTLSFRLKLCWAHHQYMTADAEMRDIVPPSTHPCAPAPGRGLVIIRTDSAPHASSFTSFDKLSMGHSGGGPYITSSAAMNRVPEADSQSNAPKKRWSLLKSISLFSGPTNSRPGEVTPPGSPDATEQTKSRQLGMPNSRGLSRPSTPPHQALAFKFSLEYTNNRPQLPGKNRRLLTPSLPHNAQKLLDELALLETMTSSEKQAVQEVKPVKPLPHEVNSARYSGRALSEWNQVIAECRNFYIRRRQEGCPRDDLVETPSMAAESFRMFG